MLSLPGLFSRLSVRLSLACALLLTSALLLVHGQSASGSELRALLLPPPDCSAPCFLGIALGSSTLNSGIEQLRVSPLVHSIAAVAPYPSSPVQTGLYDVVLTPDLASMRTMRMQFLTEPRSGVIQQIVITETGIQLSDIALSLGEPTQLVLDNRIHRALVSYVAFYSDYQMFVQVVLPVCASREDHFWRVQQNVSVGIASSARYDQQQRYYSNALFSDSEGWLQRLHDMKQTNCV